MIICRFSRMSSKNRLAAVVFVIAVFMTTARCQQRTLPTGRLQRPPPTTVPIAATKEGSNFDQQRLIALFGSEAQPVYGNRDPATGRVVLEAVNNNPVRSGSRPAASRFTPSSENVKEDIDEPVEPEDAIDRKDTRVPETNEINPFELLPPQFHDLLNIPIHDYGNGTTYNPYDKFKVPPKNKYPLVSTGYANTKYQGSPSSTTAKPTKPATQPVKYVTERVPSSYDYDYEAGDYAPVKTSRRPSPKPKSTTTTTTTTRTSTVENQRDGQYDPYSNRPTTKKQRVRPSIEIPKETESIVYRPKPPVENTRNKPAPRPQTYKEQQHQEENISETYPDNRPYNKPEKQPENRPNQKPYYYNDDEVPSHQQTDDDWPPRQAEQKPYNPISRPEFDDFNSYKLENRPKPAKEDKPQSQPSRPNYSVVAGMDDDREPIFTPHQSYRPYSDDHIAEIKVTPKPFFAADENQNFGQSPPQKTPGQVDDVPDIIYDYDDERSKGEGVLFMFDNGPAGAASGPDLSSSSGVSVKPASVTPSPVSSPYPTVASRDPRPQQVFTPAFRPSSPVRPSSDGSFLPPPSSNQGLAPNWNQPPLQKQQIGNDSPRPPFRFPSEQQQPGLNAKENQPPNILPLFRPNTNPTDEFQFIKHPQQIEFNRQQTHLQLQPGQHANLRPQSNQESNLRQQRPGAISPLPSAKQREVD